MDQNQLTPVKTKRKNVKYGIAGFSMSALFFALLILFLLLLSIILGVWALWLFGVGSNVSNEIEETVFKASAGGVVTVEMYGTKELKSVKIDFFHNDTLDKSLLKVLFLW